MKHDGTHRTLRALLAVAGVSVSLLIGLNGCHSNSNANSGPDPAEANLAPANGQAQVLGQNTAYTPQQQGQSYDNGQQAPAPIVQGYNNQPAPQSSYDQGYDQTEAAGEEAIEQTNQAPPPLPDYDQPPAPGPNYIWTPGYWAWGPSGYYWVPGAWVEAPYYGALWTPPYWGWYNNYYRFYPGYWGPHVGFYGGINYGFGYIGIGYFGGYWSGNNFYYNRAVTRIGPGVRTVYERPVVYNNVRYGMQPNNRVSYNGGRGGLNVRPTASEMAAARERHDPPMAVQRQVRTAASQNRAQFYSENHGRPAAAVEARGFANPRGIAAPPRGVQPGRANMPPPNAVAREAAPARGAEARPGVNPAAPRENAAPGARPGREARPETQPMSQPRTGARPAEQPRPEARPMEQRPEAHPAQQPRMENRAAPQPRPEEARPAPQPRNEARPAPQPRAEAPRPAPQQHAAPAPRAEPAPRPGGGHPEGEHGHR